MELSAPTPLALPNHRPYRLANRLVHRPIHDEQVVDAAGVGRGDLLLGRLVAALDRRTILALAGAEPFQQGLFAGGQDEYAEGVGNLTLDLDGPLDIDLKDDQPAALELLQ